MDTYIIGSVFVLLIILLVSGKLGPAMLFVGAACFFMFMGYIEPDELLASYTNETLIALILLLQVSSVVERTAFIPLLSQNIFVPKRRGLSLVRLSLLSMVLSSHLNNTAVVASLMGVVRNNKHFPASKLLIPLSYAAIMGGVLTLIGTSTNLIVNSFVVDAGLPAIGFYDFIYVGGPLVLIGGVYLTWILPRMLPGNKNEITEEPKDYFLEVKVSENSRLIGKSIKENGLRNMDNLFLAEVIRNEVMLSPVMPTEILQAGDRLFFTGDITQIQELRKFDGLVIVGQKMDSILEANLQEVVIRHNAPVIGRKIKDASFRTKFDAVVVGVNRTGEALSGKLGLIELKPGDNLVLAVGKEFSKHQNLYKNFIFISPVEADSAFTYRESYLAVGLFLLGILLAALNLLTLFQSMVLLIFAFLALKFLKVKDMQNNMNISLLLMIGSSLGLSQVLSSQGLAEQMGSGLMQVFGHDSPVAALIGIYIATVVITELVTNNAAAALMFPIALSTAEQLGVSPMPFIMALAYAASASFLTPIGYQTNTMVMNVGKYKFLDYVKGGWPLTLLYGVIVVWLVPYFFPF
jgi:di/tricarboxylate transporter